MVDVVGRAVLKVGGQLDPASVRTAGRQAGAELGKSGSAGGAAFGSSFGKSAKHAIAHTAAGFGIALGVSELIHGTSELFRESIGEARAQQKVFQLTTQVIKSTGGAAKVSAKEVFELAEAIEKKSTVDHEQVQSAENMLLTFKNVRNETGKGNKIFNQATQAVVNVNAAMAAAGRGGAVSMKSQAIQLGKALNDPVKGITALTRVGVTFDEATKKQIKTLVKHHKTLEAQKIILRELKSEFGGAARAQATDGTKAALAIKNLKEQIGTALLPQVDKLARFTTTKAVPAISEFVDGMEHGTGAGGDFADTLQTIGNDAKAVLKFINDLPGPVKKYGAEILIAAKVTSLLGGNIGRLSTSLGASRAAWANAETRSAKFSAAMQGVGGAIRNVAGAGGLILLQDSTHRAGTSMGLLESAAGGALSGAALGAFAGPEGAAIGGAIGGLAGAALSLAHHTESAGDAARKTLNDWQAYKDTLNAVTGATTAATRQFALQRLQSSGVIKNTEALGIADRTVVNAVVNGGKAREKVIGILQKEKAGLDANVKAKEKELAANVAAAGNTQNLTEKQIIANQDRADATRAELADLKKRRDERDKDIAATLKELGAVDKSVKAKRSDIAATADLTGKLKGIPKDIRTKIQAEGIIPTRKGIIDLSEKYHLTPKQVKTVIAASGVPLTEKQINHLVDVVKHYGSLHPKPKIDADTKEAAAKIQAIINGIAKIRDKHITITTTNANVAEATHKARGGPVMKNHPYWVGDNPDGSLNRTSEMFVPDVSGQILSASQSRALVPSPAGTSSSSTSVTVNINNPVGEEIPKSLPRMLSNLQFVLGG